MKISLVRILEFPEEETDHPRDIIPSFGLATVATMLKPEHTVFFLDNEVEQLNSREMKKELLSQKSDVIVIDFNPIVAKQIKKLIEQIKKKNPKLLIVLIGSYINYTYKDFLKESKADFVALNETELSIVDLVSRYSQKGSLTVEEKKKIKGIAFSYRNKVINTAPRALTNPDQLPFLAHEFLQNPKYKIVSKSVISKEKVKWGFLLSSRGCPYSCTFCAPSIRNSFGKPYRFQSAQRTVDEIEYMVKHFQINAISFEDDLFTLKRDRVIELCNEIIRRKIKIKWTAATRADQLDLNLAKKMKAAGCNGISLGIESGSARVLERIKKLETKEQMAKGINILHKAGIAPTINLIVGHPDETVEDLEKTLSFAKKLRPLYIHLHYFTPYPGTKFYEENKEKLGLYFKFSHRITHDFNISKIPTETLKSAIKKLYLSYYLSFSYLRVYLKYRHKLYFYQAMSELKFLVYNVRYLTRKK